MSFSPMSYFQPPFTHVTLGSLCPIPTSGVYHVPQMLNPQLELAGVTEKGARPPQACGELLGWLQAHMESYADGWPTSRATRQQDFGVRLTVQSPVAVAIGLSEADVTYEWGMCSEARCWTVS
jgi:hypothetical protein